MLMKFRFVGILKACASIGPKALLDGESIHNHLTEVAPASSSRVLLRNSLSPLENMIIFQSLISMYTRCGSPSKALALWQEHSNAPLDKFALSSTLRACSSIGGNIGLETGRKVHKQLNQLPPHSWDETLFTSLVNMYAKCDAPIEVLRLWKDFYRFNMRAPQGTLKCFLKSCAAVGATKESLATVRQIQSYICGLSSSQTDTALHNALIHALVKCGAATDALAHWNQLVSSTKFTLNDEIGASALSACSQLGPKSLALGRSIQVRVGTSRNPVYVAALITMYHKCGDMGAALQTWELFSKQLSSIQHLPDLDTVFAAMLGACTSMQNGLVIGEKVLQIAESHGYTPENNLRTCNSLMLMYAKCGASDKAISLWKQLVDSQQLQPNEFSYIAALAACESKEQLDLGISIHQLAESQGDHPMKNLRLCNYLMLMYAKCGSEKTAISLWEKAFSSGDIFQPVELSYIAILTACANLGQAAYERGKSIVGTIKLDVASEQSQVYGAIINMYGKCGSWEEAEVLLS